MPQTFEIDRYDIFKPPEFSITFASKVSGNHTSL